MGRHIMATARSPSEAWRALDSHCAPSSTSAEEDVMGDFDDVRYGKGQDPKGFWMKIEVLQSRGRTLGVDIAEEIAVNELLSSLLPPYFTTVRDDLRWSGHSCPGGFELQWRGHTCPLNRWVVEKVLKVLFAFKRQRLRAEGERQGAWKQAVETRDWGKGAAVRE